jgi:hypothetical protein
MKLLKLARDVHSSELRQDEKDRLAKLWSLPYYCLTLNGGLLLRDAALHCRKNNAVLEAFADCVKTQQWAADGLPVLLFPTTRAL